MASMTELAEHIIALGDQNGIGVSNLRLQKVMFFALGMHLRKNGIDELAENTYDIPFEKWKYGPVVESLYYQYNHLKADDITKVSNGAYSHEYSHLDKIIIDLLGQDVYRLVRVSHDMPSWAQHEDDILQRNFVESYTLDEIAEDFQP